MTRIRPDFTTILGQLDQGIALVSVAARSLEATELPVSQEIAAIRAGIAALEAAHCELDDALRVPERNAGAAQDHTEALAQNHLSSEDKFANRQFVDRGRTDRRHVIVTGVEWIWKEANQVGESGEATPHFSVAEKFAQNLAG